MTLVWQQFVLARFFFLTLSNLAQEGFGSLGKASPNGLSGKKSYSE